MRYLFGNDNLARAGAVTASNIIASQAIYRTDTAAKAGGGRVTLTGPYTGQQDSVVEVEITTATGGTLAVSQPVFTGVGNGMLDSLTATGLAPQEFVVTLENLGIATTTARAPFQGAVLRAASPGAGGNAITVSIDRIALVAEPTAFSLQEDLQSGNNEYAGEHWNFGAALLTESGDIPDDAPRLRFGDDPQVYRAWRKYKGDKYVYGFSPAPVRNVGTGAVVRKITGTYTVTLAKGATVEPYANLTSLYDALAAIRDGSTIATVQTPVVDGRRPGDMGAVDVSEWSVSYVLGIERDGGPAVQHSQLAVTADTTAPTETVTLTCIKSPATGAEIWEVRGDVSGKMPDLTTAQTWTNGHYTMTVPLPQVPGTETPTAPAGHFSIKFAPTDPKSTVAVCLDRPVLGAAARDLELTLVWTLKPPKPCDCTTDAISGGPDFDCLGIVPEEVPVSDASRVVRLQRLAAAVREYVTANTTPLYQAVPRDIAWIKDSAGILADCLNRTSTGTVSFSPWVAATEYAADQVIDNAGLRYAATVPGTSGATPPTFPTLVGSTVSDGDITWQCLGKLPYGMWDDLLETWKSEVENLSGQSGGLNDVVEWVDNQTFGTYGQTLATQRILPPMPNGMLYELVFGPSTTFTASGTAQPETWGIPLQFGSATAIDPVPTTIGMLSNEWTYTGSGPNGDWTMGLRLRCVAQYWVASTGYAVGQSVDVGNGVVYKVTTAGTTGATEPNWWSPAPDGTLTDGTVTWTASASTSFDLPDAADRTKNSYFEKWKTAADEVLAAAEVTPGFESASTNGDGCWRDFDDSQGWWVFQDPNDDYLPLQNGHYYHSSVMTVDANGDAYAQSTQEFGFGLKIGCPEKLQEGDAVTVKIRASGTVATGQGYQPGDNFRVRINHATPIAFVGGVTGTDTLTWSVRGSLAGRLADYALVTTAPTAYADAGLGMMITPGGIPFALGDSFRFSVESGQFRWRRDGGAWSADIDLGDTTLADGLTVGFVGGTAPSWVAGDTWAFTAEAINGPRHLQLPDDTRCTWASSTVIDVSVSGTVSGLLLAEHTIPPGAVITLEASDDGFATTALSETVTWRAGTIWHGLASAAMHADWRVTVNAAGSVRWLWLGDPMTLALRSGVSELGTLVKRWRLPALGRGLGLGGTVQHLALGQDSIDALLASLSAACTDDGARFAILPHDTGADAALVRYAEDSLEISDEFGHQSAAPDRLLSVSLALEAA